MPKPTAREQRGYVASFSPAATGGTLLTLGLFFLALAAMNFANGPGRYGVGPNIIIPEADRVSHFRNFSILSLSVTALLAAAGTLVILRKKWALIAAMPLLFALALLRMFASFEADQMIFFFGGLGLIAFNGFQLFGTLNWLKLHKSEAQFQATLDSDEDEIDALIRLLGSPKSAERIRALEELEAIGPEAAPAVTAIIESLKRGIPPAEEQKNQCGFCSKALSVWTRDKIKTPTNQIGVPCCIPCRTRLQEGRPGEAQHAAEALAAIGKGAQASLPVLKQASRSHDPGLQKACKEAVRAITAR